MSPVPVVSAAQDAVLAHGGGLPEAALVGAPLLVVLAFLWLERRARRRERPDQRD